MLLKFACVHSIAKQDCPTGAKVSQIAACMHHSLAVTSSGEVLSWGFGGNGQLGHGDAALPKDRDEPVPRLIGALKQHKVCSVSAGFLHSGKQDIRSFTTSCRMSSLIPLPPRASPTSILCTSKVLPSIVLACVAVPDASLPRILPACEVWCGTGNGQRMGPYII